MGVKVRERDGAWWIFVHHKGQRKAKRVGTKKAALEAARKIEAKLTLGEFKIENPKPKTLTFKEVAGRWVSLPNDDWKESTRHNYATHLELNIFPTFKDRPIDSITRKDLIEFFESLALRGLATATLKVARAVVSGVLTYALDKGLITASPLARIKVKGKAKENGEDQVGDAYTDEEAAKLLAVAETYQGGVWYPPALGLLRTGMRIGELQALQWGDVDFAGRFLEVRRSWREGRLTDTKSRKRRRVDLSAHLAETLKALRVTEKKRALASGREVSEWIFADDCGKMLDRDRFRRAVHKCEERAGLRQIRVHDLRHTYASIRINRGHDLADVSRQLGHSSIKITHDLYGHLIPGTHKRQVDDLDTVEQFSVTPAQPTEKAARIV